MSKSNPMSRDALLRAARRLHARLHRGGVTTAPDVAVETGRLLSEVQDRAGLLQAVDRAEVYLGQMRNPPSRDLLLEAAAAFFGRRDWNALSAALPSGTPSPVTANQHPLPLGTAIRSRLSQMDEGDFGERHSLPGAVGFIVGYFPKQDSCYHVAFEPSGVLGFWSGAEVDALAEVLPEGHADIPTSAERALSLAVRDLFYDCQHDEERQEVLVPAEAAMRLRAAVNAPGVKPEVVGAIFGLFPYASEFNRSMVSFTAVNALAELIGVGDRLVVAPRPMVTPETSLSSAVFSRLLARSGDDAPLAANLDSRMVVPAAVQTQGLAGTLRHIIARAPRDEAAGELTFSNNEAALLRYLAALENTPTAFDAVIPADPDDGCYKLTFEQVDRLAEAADLPDRLVPIRPARRP